MAKAGSSEARPIMTISKKGRKMNAKERHRLVSLCVCGMCLLMLVGCGQTDDRRSLEGTVTLDGVPLAEGNIALRPLPGTGGPTAGGNITEGKFAISPEQGTFVGTFRVEITATRKTGRKVMDPILQTEIDETEQFIPVRFNRQSELTAEVTADGPNRFEFALNSE